MSVVDAKKSKLISNADVEAVIRESKMLPRRRVPILVHDSYDEAPQRFVNCMSVNSYIRPHLHENNNQWELVIWVSGDMLVLIFDTDGTILKRIEFGQCQNRIVEIQQNLYHAFVPITDCAYFEVRNCKFDPGSDRQYAAWAPEEGGVGVDDFFSWMKSAEVGQRYAKP